MIIRRLMSRHLPAVAEHFQRLPKDDIYLRFIRPATMEWVQTRYLPSIDLASHIALGAVEGGKVVGFCHMAPYPEQGFVELGLSIDVEWRQRGVGSQLIARAKTYAKLLGFSELKLVCARDNHKMIRLARKHGISFVACESEFEGATPLQVIDVADLAGAIQDEQSAGAQDIWEVTVERPLSLFCHIAADMTESALEFQRQLLGTAPAPDSLKRVLKPLRATNEFAMMHARNRDAKLI